MPRIRTYKPDAFRSEHLARVSIPARWLFLGLLAWEADREGRMKWQLRRWQADVFPFDVVNIEALVRELVEADLIWPYDTPTHGRCAWVPTFTQHQRPHPKEPPSVLPAHPSLSAYGRAAVKKNGEPGKNTASTGSIPATSRRDPLGKERKEYVQNDQGTVSSDQISQSRSDLAKKQKSTETIPSEAAVAVWNDIKKSLDLKPHNRREWFDPCRVLGLQRHTLFIDAVTISRASWLTQHYHRRLAEAAKALDPELTVRISVTSRARKEARR